MRRRKLGNTGLEVSEISFGAWQLGNNDDWGGMDDVTAHSLVAEALDRGVNLFDTAPNYASTNSERILGESLLGKRDQVVLVSKFGHRPEGPKDFSVDWFRESLEASLRRLRTDHLDVLLLHNPPESIYRGTDPIWNALDRAKGEGKIRHYGASLDFAAEIEACLDNTGSEVLEIFFNILHQDVRRAFPLVRERGAGIIVKIPLDSGWLTGRFNAESTFNGIRARWSPEQVARRAELVGKLKWLAAGDSQLSQKALAFVLSYDEVSCAIPGIRNRHQLQTNLEAVGQTITDEDRARLEEFWEEITGNGSNLLPW
jgi:aryl-alcohol dehydrogenase-like predicted oxidoreductase